MREKWYDAWRRMRVIYDPNGGEKQFERFVRLDRLHWLAYCRLVGRTSIDPLTISPKANLMALKIIQEIMGEA